MRKYNLFTKEYKLYKDQHTNQTLNHVINKMNEYSVCNKERFTIIKAIKLMDSFVDVSDPDFNEENSIHAYQTAERIKKDYPLDKSFQITGLIHDLGKILYIFKEPSWNIVGDTYPVGCKFSDKIVYNETFESNSDKYDKRYNTKYGIYEPNCGIENLIMSFGHDEYLYQVLNNNSSHKLNKKYLNMIRYHSFYSWHTEGDYKYFMKEKDKELLEDVKKLNKYDLYSKNDSKDITDDIKNYYEKLLNEFFPEPLNW